MLILYIISTKGVNPPLIITVSHDHEPDHTRLEVVKFKAELAFRAKNTNDPPRTIISDTLQTLSTDAIWKLSRPDAMKQCVRRLRNKKFSLKRLKATSLEELVIPEEMKKTMNKESFLLADTGSNDKNRILIFATEQNLRILDDNRDWYCDGTFGVTSLLFKQLYTIHVIIDKSVVPLIYCLLPNKKQTTYNKMVY